MTAIPPSFEAAREAFRLSLAACRELWPAARLTSLPLSDSPDLTIDVISAGATRTKNHLLFLTSGLHGIEGYVDSGILQLFAEEFLPRLDPETTGIVLIHPINPYGMKHYMRFNKNNVDLNRNFAADFEELKAVNPQYESLSALLNPAHSLKSPFVEKAAFLWNVIKALPRGVTTIREAALMGQYRLQEGMYFGGFEQQQEVGILKDIANKLISGYEYLLALDIHAGYGPRWGLTLVNPSSEKRTAAQVAEKYHLPLVVGSNPEEFYTMHGEMGDFLLDLAKSRKIQGYVGTFEFGTYGDSFWQGIRSLRTTVLENSLRLHGGSPAAKKWMQKEYRDLYIPSELKWWQTAQENARLYFVNILKGEGFI